MSRWFRHYAGMMRDDKLVRVALKAKQPIERVLWVWGAILESAAEIDDGGRYDFDRAEGAYFLRADESDISSICDALEAIGRVSGDVVVKWGDRQFQSDRSAGRQARYREKQRLVTEADRHVDGEVTVSSRHGDAPETETETETETEKKSSLRSDRRATRLPADWAPNDVDFAYARSKGMTPDQIRTEAEKFHNHWTAKGGKDAAKLDWPATWRNWILTAIDRMPRQNHGRKQDLSALAFELADEVRLREREAGIEGTAAAVGSR